MGPCNKVYWYLAEDSRGRRGVVPINHLCAMDGPVVITTTPPTPAGQLAALHPTERPPLAPPPADRPPVAPPPADRPPVATPPADCPSVAKPTAVPPSSNRDGDYSYGERPFLPPPEQRHKSEKPRTRPSSTCKYPDVLAFRANSGWCTPSVDEVRCLCAPCW